MKITYEETSHDFKTPSIKIEPGSKSEAFELGKMSKKMDHEYRKEYTAFGDVFIRIKLPIKDEDSNQTSAG